ncbi:MAG: universal stress protein [Nannocystaceae bacterium]
MSATVTPFARILVPIDFAAASEESIKAGESIEVDNQHIEIADASRRALAVAAGLARLSSGTLLLVHVTPPLNYNALYTGAARNVGLSGEMINEVHRAARETSLHALKTLADQVCSDLQVQVEARPGIALYTILEEAGRFQADLIVLAASGRSRVARFFVGSTADRVIREANCPVLVIPATRG